MERTEGQRPWHWTFILVIQRSHSHQVLQHAHRHQVIHLIVFNHRACTASTISSMLLLGNSERESHCSIHAPQNPNCLSCDLAKLKEDYWFTASGLEMSQSSATLPDDLPSLLSIASSLQPDSQIESSSIPNVIACLQKLINLEEASNVSLLLNLLAQAIPPSRATDDTIRSVLGVLCSVLSATNSRIDQLEVVIGGVAACVSPLSSSLSIDTSTLQLLLWIFYALRTLDQSSDAEHISQTFQTLARRLSPLPLWCSTLMFTRFTPSTFSTCCSALSRSLDSEIALQHVESTVSIRSVLVPPLCSALNVPTNQSDSHHDTTLAQHIASSLSKPCTPTVRISLLSLCTLLLRAFPLSLNTPLSSSSDRCLCHVTLSISSIELESSLSALLSCETLPESSMEVIAPFSPEPLSVRVHVQGREI